VKRDAGTLDAAGHKARLDHRYAGTCRCNGVSGIAKRAPLVQQRFGRAPLRINKETDLYDVHG